MRATVSVRQFLLWPPRLVGLAVAVLTLIGLAVIVLFPNGFADNDLEARLVETALFALLALLGVLLSLLPAPS